MQIFYGKFRKLNGITKLSSIRKQNPSTCDLCQQKHSGFFLRSFVELEILKLLSFFSTHLVELIQFEDLNYPRNLIEESNECETWILVIRFRKKLKLCKVNTVETEYIKCNFKKLPRNIK